MEIKSQLIDAQFEMVLNEASLPANGKPGRVMFVIDIATVVVDDGTIWKRLSGGSLGDVRQSTLKPQEFYAENGNTWVLADGRSAVGSDWFNLTLKTNVPDYRGVFLRSINDDPDPTPGKEPPRADGLENPDGQKDVDQYTDDKTNENGLSIASVGDHNHNLGIIDEYAEQNGSGRYTNRINNTTGDPLLSGTQTGNAGGHTHSWLTSDNETAPKHGHVYTYIKINR